MAACATCGTTSGIQRCSKCGTVSYCSKDCQKKDFEEHKKNCKDALTRLCLLPTISTSSKSTTATKCFDTAEIRMAFLSFLQAKDLLKAQGVCRLWYVTIALEVTLQQRLFLAPGPGPLVYPTYEGGKIAMGIQPRDNKQLGHANMTKSPAWGGAGYLLLLSNSSGVKDEVPAMELENMGIPIVLNPFFTKLWPQDPTNMTNSPYITVPTNNKAASWRRMQISSPPTLELGLNIWYTHHGKGNQLTRSTGKKASGITLGHLADLLARLPTGYTLHWIWPHASAFWARSSDAVVVTGMNVGEESRTERPGVYVNPTNGVPFPGGF